jgi:hypothetical protein
VYYFQRRTIYSQEKPMEEYVTHNIVTTPEDDAIVAAVQKRIGASANQGYSTAIRFIIREFALHADPNGTILNRIQKPVVKPTARRGKARKTVSVAEIDGVRKGAIA